MYLARKGSALSALWILKVLPQNTPAGGGGDAATTSMEENATHIDHLSARPRCKGPPRAEKRLCVWEHRVPRYDITTAKVIGVQEAAPVACARAKTAASWANAYRPPTPSLSRQVKDEYVKAAHDGSVKVFVVACIVFQRWNPRQSHAYRRPRCPWATREGRAHEGRGAGHCGGRGGGRATGLDFRGPGGARPPRHATTAAAAALVQLALRLGNWAAQWRLARTVGKRFRGVRRCRAKRKAPLCLYNYTGPGFGRLLSWLALSIPYKQVGGTSGPQKEPPCGFCQGAYNLQATY